MQQQLLSRLSCPTLCDPIDGSPPGSPIPGVGCHFLLQCMKATSESEVTQLCPTLSDPTDCSPPGSSIHGIFQARALQYMQQMVLKEIRILWRLLRLVRSNSG